MAEADKNKRKAIKCALTRFENYFNVLKLNKNVASTDLVELETRLQKFESYLDEFNVAQLSIEALDSDLDTNYDQHAGERENFENKFYRITSEARKFLIDRFQPTPNVCNTGNLELNTSSNDDDLCDVKLPPINLPTFDGSYDQWLFFRDTFGSLIHNNNKLTAIKKFHYLRLSLKDKAAETIAFLEISDINYTVAWNILSERFENKQILVNNHVSAIFNLPFVLRESHRGIRELLDGTQKHLGALKVLKMPTEHWDVLICHIITSKFRNSITLLGAPGNRNNFQVIYQLTMNLLPS